MSSMDLYLRGEEENRKTGMLLSIIAHLLLLLLLFPHFFKSQIIPPGQKGILIQFGVIDAVEGVNEDSGQLGVDEVVQEIQQESQKPPPQTPNEEQAPATANLSDENPKVVDKTSDISVEEERARKRKEEEARKKAEAEEAERRKAEEEARRQQEFEERKKKFGDILSGGNNQGETPGNTGDPKGDPDKGVLDEIAKGSGKVGGGLSNRGVVYEPVIQENSQRSGTVVIEICVNISGEVISAKFTQRGSTTTDRSLVEVAIDGAKKYKFAASEIEKQCGTVTVNFIVK